ncbi:MAG: CpaD family pilus assembly lipoprotein [Alphaproteobacteria bacterium]
MADAKKIKSPWLAFALGFGMALTLASCAADDAKPHGAAANDAKLPNLTEARPCPPWAAVPAFRHGNADAPYLGCANHVNLANMLESPSDLDQGRPLGFADGERETVVLKDYDQNKSTGFKETNAPKSALGAPASTTGGSP